MTHRFWTYAIVLVLVVQALCAVFFVYNIAVALFGLTPLPWTAYEALELGAAVGLLSGSIIGAFALRRSFARTALVEAQLRAASGAFMELLEERFVEWGLTPAEADVALFAIKGMSLSDIAALRNTSEGTVKAQTNAIYRKAGVSGRPQLLSLFIDELMSGPVTGGPANAPEPPAVRSAEDRVGL
ncbi:helix-turn-helix transcriptional regulator [Flavimaricola marinus]|uniref:Bacterial regulatory proteins, luxR family n=1 Tax=Flavimaricola marinus TaxID=1819565 RepID=A0A238LGE1_9RHOB|nr:LuxR C-terminal-related transcriptional regulator [Flavimaricola marinus]SMY08475.1 Bacterial regulatory proteins, luxR family [Flavimaricola marinus]